jgi:predicted nucleic acid-binding protein
MKVLIDTNVIIDYLADRMPFAEHAEQVLGLCESGRVTGLVTANAIADIYYVVRKKWPEGRERWRRSGRSVPSWISYLW